MTRSKPIEAEGAGIIEKAIQIANNISSPWGEGATYDSIFKTRPIQLDIKREFGVSHLNDLDWRTLVEDIVALAKGVPND